MNFFLGFSDELEKNAAFVIAPFLAKALWYKFRKKKWKLLKHVLKNIFK